MKRKLFLTNLFLIAGLLFFSTAFTQKNGLVDKKLNVIVILADDLGCADLSAYGSTFYETPNLDNLAANGIRFSQAYATCPVCSPTRASMMTGKYPVKTGVTFYEP